MQWTRFCYGLPHCYTSLRTRWWWQIIKGTPGGWRLQRTLEDIYLGGARVYTTYICSIVSAGISRGSIRTEDWWFLYALSFLKRPRFDDCLQECLLSAFLWCSRRISTSKVKLFRCPGDHPHVCKNVSSRVWFSPHWSENEGFEADHKVSGLLTGPHVAIFI